MTSTSRSTAHSALSPYGWDEDWADAFAPYAAEGLLPGRVVRVDRGQCDVVTPDGVLRADTAFVTPHDPLRVVCTGDWVAVEPDGNPRYVRTYLPRRTAFVRSTSSKRSEGQILAANVDHAIVAVSLAVELDLARVERFLALAWESGAQPLVVLTKADLVPDPVTLAHLVQDVETSAPGVTVLAVSAALGEGLDVLAAVVGGGTAVLLGQSGAGKSTLANALLGEDVMDVQATRDVDGKGRHTTTTRNLLVMPGGGVLIDTPGLRGVGLWDAAAVSGRSSPRSRNWRATAASTTAPTRASRAVPSSPPSTTANCPNGGWRATASSCGRTSASSPRPTPGCAPRSARSGSGGVPSARRRWRPSADTCGNGRATRVTSPTRCPISAGPARRSGGDWTA